MEKVVGKKRKLTPQESLIKLETLMKEMDILRTYKKKKGLVLKFKSYEEHNIFILLRAAKKL